MLGGRLLGPGLSVSLLPLLLLVFAFFLSTEQEPSARTGHGPFDGKHCHAGEYLVPPKTHTGHHTHDDFHSGIVKAEDWEAFSEKHKAHLDDPDVGYGPDGDNYMVTFPSHWKPAGQRTWHNHGDDDIGWWTPDNNNCTFSPTFSEASYSFEVDENEPIGTSVGFVQAYDEDGEEPRYSQVGGDTRYFAIHSVSGEITTRRVLDYEKKNSYSLTVRARDPGGRNDRALVAISVVNVDEQGHITLSGTPGVGNTLTAKLSDPDGGISGETWSWEHRAGPSNAWTTLVRSSLNTYTPTGADAGKHMRVTVNYDDGQGQNKSTISKAVLVQAQAAPTNTPTPTPTPTPTNTPTPTPTQKAVVRPATRSTSTPTPTPTAVPLSAARSTPRPTTRATSTPTRTNTPTPTVTPRPTITPTSAPPNSPPFFVDGESTERALLAGVGANTAVGGPIVAVDPDGDPVTFSRDGADMGYFILNTVTGQVWTAKALPAGRQSLALKLWAEDGRGGVDFIDVRVRVEGPQGAPTPAPVLVELPTKMPTPTPTSELVALLQVSQKVAPTPTLRPIPSPTATIDTSRWGPGRKINTPTPMPEREIPVVDIGEPRGPAQVVLAQSEVLPTDPAVWPRIALWLGGVGLMFALFWLMLMFLRDRRREQARAGRLARPGSRPPP